MIRAPGTNQRSCLLAGAAAFSLSDAGCLFDVRQARILTRTPTFRAKEAACRNGERFTYGPKGRRDRGRRLAIALQRSWAGQWHTVLTRLPATMARRQFADDLSNLRDIRLEMAHVYRQVDAGRHLMRYSATCALI